MKGLLILSLLTLASFAIAEVNLGDNLQVKNVLPVAAVTASANGSAIDLQELSGQVAAMADVSAPVAGSSPTMDLKLQDSADGSTGWADVSGGAFVQVTSAASNQKLSLNKDSLKRYVRVVKTIGGTSSPQYLVSVKILGIKKYK
jgi:hypothetical protein